MELSTLLERKNITKYRLSKLSEVPQTTILDICSNKSKIDKCSALTLFKIASCLNIKVEDFFTKEVDNISPKEFDVFKSSVCHEYKNSNKKELVDKIASSNEIEKLFKEKKYAKAFYLLALIDYICDTNKIKRIEKYEKFRCLSLLDPIFPQGILLLDKTFKTNKYKKKALKEAIPQFKNFNIIESDIENVA